MALSFNQYRLLTEEEKIYLAMVVHEVGLPITADVMRHMIDHKEGRDNGFWQELEQVPGSHRIRGNLIFEAKSVGLSSIGALDITKLPVPDLVR